MRFEVPQFIEIEDKIIGPFTWRQFIYLAGGVGFAVVIFIVTNFFFFVLIGIPLALLSAALAFYSVNNRPFSHFLESMTGYFRRSRLYLWKKSGSGIYGERKEVEEPSIAAYVPKNTNGNLSTLARKLELKAIQKNT